LGQIVEAQQDHADQDSTV